MNDQLTISLKNLRFRAYHGLYPEERQKGNDFVVNLQIDYLPVSPAITALHQTIDYAEVFEIINSTMQKPVDLLETLAQSMAVQIHHQFPQVTGVRISVEKLNPPIDRFSGSVEVKFSAQY